MKRQLDDTNGSKVDSKKGKNHQLPSRDEQLVVHQTSILARENLINLQANGMLEEVSCEAVYSSKKLRRCIDSICNIILQATTNKTNEKWCNLFQIEKKNDKKMIPPPSHVQVIGSYDIQTLTHPYVNIDLCCTIPVGYFDHRDFLNYAYHKMRSEYVASIASFLDINTAFQELILEESLAIAYMKGDLSKPILTFQPSVSIKGMNKLTHPISIRLLFTIAAGTFELTRLLPNKNNLTQIYSSSNSSSSSSSSTNVNVMNDDNNSNSNTIESIFKRITCAEYNASIVEDLAILPQHRLLSSILTSSSAAQQAVILLKIWITQRELRWGLECVDGHSMALLVAYMIQTKRVIQSTASALSIFQTVIQFLCEFDLLSSTVALNFQSNLINITTANNDNNSNSNHAIKFQQRVLFPICLYHPLLGINKTDIIDFNCFWRVSESCYHRLYQEAQHTKLLLQSGHESAFLDIFLKKSSFFHQFDVYYHIPINIHTFKHSMNIDDTINERDNNTNTTTTNSKHTTKSNNNSSSSSSSSSNNSSNNAIMMTKSLSLSLLNRRVYQVLNTALPIGDRVMELVTTIYNNNHNSNSNSNNKDCYSAHVFHQSNSSNKTTVSSSNSSRNSSNTSSGDDNCSIVIGLILNPENCTRRVDRGPAATTSNSNTNTTSLIMNSSSSSSLSSLLKLSTSLQFKSFWGNKSETRRFKDGAIVEAIVWGSDNSNNSSNTSSSVSSSTVMMRSSNKVNANVSGSGGSGGGGVVLPRIEGIVESIIRYILNKHVPDICSSSSSSSSINNSSSSNGNNNKNNTSNDNSNNIYSVGCKLEQSLPCEAETIAFLTNTPTTTTSTTTDNAAATITIDPRIASSDYTKLCQTAVTAMDALRTMLTSQIKGMPLNIDSLVSTSPCLRYTALFPPLPHPLLAKLSSGDSSSSSSSGNSSSNKHTSSNNTTGGDMSLIKLLSGHQVSLIVEPIHLHAIFGHSGQWPSDREGVRKLITVMMTVVSEKMKSQFQVRSIPHARYLDIGYEGFLFRVHFSPQSSLTTHTRLSSGSSGGVNTLSTSVNVYSAIDTLHHQAIRSLQSQYPSYSHAVRLLLTWVHGQCFSSHFTQQACELLVASVYLRPDTARVPTSPSAAFILALKRLTDWDWQTGALPVSFVTDSTATSATATDELDVNMSDPNNNSKNSNNNSNNMNNDNKLKHKYGTQAVGVDNYSISFYCQYGIYSSQMILRSDTSLEPMVRHILLMTAKNTVLMYMNMLQTIPTIKQNQSMFHHHHHHHEGEAVHSILYNDTILKKNCNILFYISPHILLHNNNTSSSSSSSSSSSYHHKNNHSKTVVTSGGDVAVTLSNICKGPKFGHMRMFANLSRKESDIKNIIIGSNNNDDDDDDDEKNNHHASSIITASCAWQEQLINKLTHHFGHVAVFFWSALHGDCIGLVWRPKIFLAHTFSVLQSRYKVVIPNLESSSESTTDSSSASSNSNSNILKKSLKDAVVMPAMKEKAADGGGEHLAVTNVSEMLNQMVALSEGLIVDIQIQ